MAPGPGGPASEPYGEQEGERKIRCGPAPKTPPAKKLQVLARLFLLLGKITLNYCSYLLEQSCSLIPLSPFYLLCTSAFIYFYNMCKNNCKLSICRCVNVKYNFAFITLSYVYHRFQSCTHTMCTVYIRSVKCPLYLFQLTFQLEFSCFQCKAHLHAICFIHTFL